MLSPFLLLLSDFKAYTKLVKYKPVLQWLSSSSKIVMRCFIMYAGTFKLISALTRSNVRV